MNSIRRERLRQLIRERGGANQVAKALGYSNATFLSQMAGPNPSREISETTARRIERAFGLPELWLDHAEGAKNGTISLPDCVEMVIRVVREYDRKFSPRVVAKLVEVEYDHALKTGQLDPAHLRSVIEVLMTSSL